MLSDQDNALIAELAPNGILVVRGSEARIKEIGTAVLAKHGDNTIAILPMGEQTEALWLSEELLSSGGWVKTHGEHTCLCTPHQRAVLDALP